MKTKLEEITIESGKAIKTRYVIADFAKLTTYSEYEKVA